MNNYKFISIVIINTLISISLYLSLENMVNTLYSEVFGQSTPTVQITKDLTNSYIISSSSSQIGTFHSTYTISGNVDTIKKDQKLIISTITGDFNNSSIVGYVKISAVPKQQQQPTSPNPFADKTTISKKIETEISSVLSSSTSSNFVKTSIHCDFGMSLSDWKCKSLGLVD